MMFSTELTPAETERLALLAEEMGECLQLIGKVLRHGYESCDPTDPGKGSNREQLEKEVGQVQFATTLLCVAGDLHEAGVEDGREQKAQAVWKWLHYQTLAKRDYRNRYPLVMGKEPR